MFITKTELRNLCKKLANELRNESSENFAAINKNIKKIIKNKNVFWSNLFENYEAIKNIYRIFYRIKNLEDFLFYAYYFILKDQKIRNNGFTGEVDFKKLFDRLFDWEKIYELFQIDMSNIHYSFIVVYQTVVDIKLYELKIKNDISLKIKFKKIKI